jgi:hypothetical protein
LAPVCVRSEFMTIHGSTSEVIKRSIKGGNNGT